jgi:DNA gyrase subunit A
MVALQRKAGGANPRKKEACTMDVVLVTANGMVKRTNVDEFRQQGRGGGGITAMSVGPGDKVVGAVALAATAGGTAIRFSAADLRSMGRTAQGVRAIRLKEGDKVVGVVAL